MTDISFSEVVKVQWGAPWVAATFDSYCCWHRPWKPPSPEQSWHELLMLPPFFLVYDGDVLVFDSMESAENYAEPVDVANSEFLAYDAEGRLIKFAWTERCVHFSQVEAEPNHAQQLEFALRNFLRGCGVSLEKEESYNLARLVEICRDLCQQKRSI